MAYIECKDVVKRFGDNTVLDHIRLEIPQGSLVTVTFYDHTVPADEDVKMD